MMVDDDFIADHGITGWGGGKGGGVALWGRGGASPPGPAGNHYMWDTWDVALESIMAQVPEMAANPPRRGGGCGPAGLQGGSAHGSLTAANLVRCNGIWLGLIVPAAHLRTG